MRSKDRVSAVIPIHNGLPHIIRCIESLRQSEGSGHELHIIVVDDGSTDSSGTEVRNAFPDVEIVSGHGELWWTGAMDLGTRLALASRCDYVLWINHDDQITSGSLQALLEFVRSNPRTIGCCGGGTLNVPSQNLLLGYRLHYTRWFCETLLSPSALISAPTEIDLNGGHGILIPVEVFDDPCNHLRPKLLPHYFGDFDFFIRVRKSGWKVFCVPGAVILNDHANSGLLDGQKLSSYKKSIDYITSRRSISNLRDRPLFALMNFPLGLNLIWAAIFLVVPIGCAIVYPALAALRKKPAT